MRNPWGPKPAGEDPWKPPLNSVPPGDWPKTEFDQETPRGMHHPWSPPRHGSDTKESMLAKKAFPTSLSRYTFTPVSSIQLNHKRKQILYNLF